MLSYTKSFQTGLYLKDFANNHSQKKTQYDLKVVVFCSDKSVSLSLMIFISYFGNNFLGKACQL
jgi:hypothetical protein